MLIKPALCGWRTKAGAVNPLESQRCKTLALSCLGESSGLCQMDLDSTSPFCVPTRVSQGPLSFLLVAFLSLVSAEGSGPTDFV